MSVLRIDTNVEWILAYITSGNAGAVWEFLARRILNDQLTEEAFSDPLRAAWLRLKQTDLFPGKGQFHWRFSLGCRC